jgi:ribose 5-phosphate isomerase B
LALSSTSVGWRETVIGQASYPNVKRFEIITESDARTLDRGETVALSRRGHVTPLAEDTLRERRIAVVREGSPGPDDASLVPAADIRRIAIASDHVGVALRKVLVDVLRGRGLAVDDQGTHGTDAVDYPDVAAGVACSVARGEADAGIVIDGAGIGSAIAANKVRGIRAVNANTETLARYSREHNGANVLTLGSTLVTPDEAKAIVSTWIGTAMREPRYIRRLAKIRDLEVNPL